jgi:hypothetical protein
MASRQTPAAPDYSSGASLAEPAPQPARPAAPVVPPPEPTPASTSNDVEAAQLRERLARTINERDAALAEVNRLRFQQPETSSERPKPKREVAFTPPPEIPRQTTHITEPVLPAPPLVAARPQQPQGNPIVGRWFYRPSESSSRNKELYPPEFIETSISEDNGELRGTYRARYHVVDRPVPPEVNFQFSGKLTGDSGSLPWSGSGGSRGEVTFRLMADHSLKVDWVASQLGQLGFYKGTAVLVKRSE